MQMFVLEACWKVSVVFSEGVNVDASERERERERHTFAIA